MDFVDGRHCYVVAIFLLFCAGSATTVTRWAEAAEMIDRGKCDGAMSMPLIFVDSSQIFRMEIPWRFYLMAIMIAP